MADAGGTTTLVKIGTEGPYNKYIVHNTSVDSAETIPVDVTGSPIKAEDRVMVLGAQDWTNETSAASGNMTVEYDETALHFTFTDSGVTNASVAICFLHIPAADKDLGSA
jgi:hypothetical protein